MTDVSQAEFHLSPLLTLAMAGACGLAVANIYYNQPLLGVILDDFPGSRAAAAIPTATQMGYALGLFLLVPLGDLYNRRKLIAGQFLFLAVALALAAAAPDGRTLAAASLLVGMGATVAQQIVPFAATLARPEQRGGVIGTVMAGLLSGILLSRTLAGFVGHLEGWRSMFMLGVPLAVTGAFVMGRVLPDSKPAVGMAYGRIMLSLVELWRREPVLRRSTLIQAGLFGSFSAFWAVLALHLRQFGLGSEAAGLFGVVALAGVIAAPAAGRVADARGPGLVVTLATLLTAASWAVFALIPGVWGLGVGVVLLDLAIQGALVSNQTLVYSLRPEARSRINTVFMTGMFLGGAAGSAGATLAWGAAGWTGVSLFGAVLGLAAAGLWIIKRRRPSREV